MTQRDDMGREVGGGFRIGNSCTPMADSCQCMAKPIQCCKVKKKKKERNISGALEKKRNTWASVFFKKLQDNSDVDLDF